jgi:putative FmdB family regulatory protein
MPKYVFECPDCNVRFERNLKLGEHTTHECPSCKDDAPLVIEGFSFEFAPRAGGTQANTGVHGQDYPTADQAVGRSATSRWAHVREREKVKQEARKQGGTPALIRHTGKDYVDYEPMSDAGRQARRALARTALQAQAAKKQG